MALEGENTVYTTIRAKCNAFESPVSDFIAEEDETEEAVSETAETIEETVSETEETSEISETVEAESETEEE